MQHMKSFQPLPKNHNLVPSPSSAQLDKRRFAELEVVGSNPGRVKTTDLKITQENVLPLLWHLQIVRHSNLTV